MKFLQFIKFSGETTIMHKLSAGCCWHATVMQGIRLLGWLIRCTWRRFDKVVLGGATGLEVYLVDGTYELFRHYYALPPARDRDGREVAAVRGVLRSVLGMIHIGATHVAVATDHVIESFRNGLWPGYKTGEGIEPDLLAQFSRSKRSLRLRA
jgi:hypothetical protein